MDFKFALDDVLDGFVVTLDTPQEYNKVWIERQELGTSYPLTVSQLLSEDWKRF